MTGGELPRTLVADLPTKLGASVRVCGWVRENSSCAATPIVVLGDHTGLAHLVAEHDGRLEDVMAGLVRESAIEVVGTAQRAPDGSTRVVVADLHVAGPADAPLPIDEQSPPEQRLDWRHLDLRRPGNRLIFEVQTTAERAMRAFWAEQGFIEVHSPKLRPTPNKSGDQLFAVDYFGGRAYLAQSPQFYKQMAMAAGFDRVFEIGPVFRQQPQPTSRHDTEFTSVDIEMAWIGSEDELLAHEEEMLRRVIAAVQAAHADEVMRCFATELRVPSTPFPRVTLAEAKEIVAATGCPAGPADDDLDAEGERRLAEHVARTHGHEFVFVTHYPEPSRPFYHMRCDEDSVQSRSFDLLWNGLEITSGAQREHRYDRLVAQARARGIPTDLIGGYLDFFRFGCPPHGGFGLGLTRMLMSMLEVSDVREVTYLFRGPDRLTP